MKPPSKPRQHDRLIARIAEYRRPGFTGSHNLVLRHLADRTNNQTGVAYPSVTEIAKCTWLSPDKVSKAIKDLERAGLLTVERRSNRSSVYALVALPALDEVASDHIPEEEDHISEYDESAGNVNTTSLSLGGYQSSTGGYQSLTGRGTSLLLGGYQSLTGRTAIEPPEQNTPERVHEQEPLPSACLGHSPSESSVFDAEDVLDIFDDPMFPTSLRATPDTPQKDPAPPQPPTARDTAQQASVEELRALAQEKFNIAPADIEPADLHDLLETCAVTPAKARQIVRWAADTSNGAWASKIRSSSDLLIHFGTLTGQYQRFMDRVLEKRKAGPRLVGKGAA